MLAGFTRFPLHKKIIIGILVLACGVLALFLGQPRTENYEKGGWDFQAIWMGPYLLMHGESPYDADTWLGEHERDRFEPQNDTFLYPLASAVPFLPIGFFPLRVAAVIWAALTLGAILYSIYLILKPHTHFKPPYFLPILIGVFLFRPVSVTLYLLQVDWIVLVSILGGWYLWLHDRWFLGGLAVAFAIVKPQIGLPILAFQGVWQLFRRCWMAILGVGVALVALLVLGLAFDPNWIGRWLSIGGDKTAQNFFSTPTLWGLSSLVCQPSLVCVQWLGAVLSILASLIVLWVILRRNHEDLTYIMSTVVCGSLLISPYLWTYSQLLLIFPLLMVTIALYRLNWPYLVVATTPLILALVSFGLVVISILIGADMLSALLPIFLWISVILLERKDPKLLRAAF